ncbi:MAG TPA: MATE family efflux transporter [Negativicutes bacterium]|nr:MATE family efflux transporter [Negativicutes bacterium]
MKSVAQSVDMAQGKVSYVLGRLALPLMVSLFFQNLYTYVNTIFVSWLGEIPLAAVSMTLPLNYLALSIAKGVAMGSVILMSYARGSGDDAGARRVSAALLPLMTILMAIFLPLMSSGFCRLFYYGIGASESIALQGTGYTFWMVAGFPVMGYVMAIEALFTSQGDTVTPMKAMLLGNLLNIALDPLCIFVFEWGVTGAAIATFTGQSVAAIYIGYKLWDKFGEKLSLLPDLGFLQTWQKILGQGMFVTAAYLVSPVALMMLNGILARFGPVAVGAWNLMSRSEMMIMLPVMGLSNALATFTGFNLGRRNYDRIRDGLHFFLIVSWGIITPVMGIFFFFPQELIGWFRPTPELQFLGGIAMQASGVSGLFAPLLYAVAAMSQGSKRPVYMMALMFVYLICLRIPLASLFAEHWGQTGVFWSHPAASACTAVIAIILLRRLMKKCKQTTNDMI